MLMVETWKWRGAKRAAVGATDRKARRFRVALDNTRRWMMTRGTRKEANGNREAIEVKWWTRAKECQAAP